MVRGIEQREQSRDARQLTLSERCPFPCSQNARPNRHGDRDPITTGINQDPTVLLGGSFLNYYTEFTGGRRIISLEHHYLAYRAVVRAKVASVRYVQGVGEAAEQARLLAALALGHLRAGESRLILVGGLPGTGKSTVAGGVADELNAVLLRSDRVRKEDEQRDPRSSGAGEWEHGLYRPDATRHTYAILLRRARELLAFGENVVLDASWNDADQRASA